MTTASTARPSTSSGENSPLQAAVRVVLVLLIIGQVVFLAGRWRVRADLTADQFYTLTDTSRRVLDGLEDRLLIECYFSDESRLPVHERPRRRTVMNFLAEYEKLGKGKVVVEFYDPHDDNQVREKAGRLGIQPQVLSDVGQASYSVQEVWQGVRLMYGANKQNVIPYLPMQAATFAYEAILIPLIKDLTVVERPKIAMLASQTEIEKAAELLRQQPEPPKTFSLLPRVVERRYQLEPIKLDEGQLIPDQYDRLVVIRPKLWTDRQKYALDQFLMRGGSVLMFVDTAEVQIGRYRAMAVGWIGYDSSSSEVLLFDQLAHYGAKVDPSMVADAFNGASVPFSVPVRTEAGTMVQNFPYPYWVQARNIDYAKHAAEIAASGGPSQQDLVQRYRETFKRGINIEHELFQGVKDGQENLSGPTFFWPCSVDLTEPLPEGVSGQVLMRTSPMAFSSRPTGHLHPLDQSRDPRKWQAAYETFVQGLRQRLNSDPRQQFGLMVALQGTFPSFFEGKKIPPRNAAAAKLQEEAAKAKEDRETAAKEPLDEPLGKPPVAKDDAGVVGPPAPAGADAAAGGEPAPIWRAAPRANLAVIADSDFLRDDLIAEEYQQAGGPTSPGGPAFFMNLLDWLAQDRDLLALRSRQFDPPQIAFAKQDLAMEADPAGFSEKVRSREKLVQWFNILVPAGLMLLLWLVVALQRRARKKTFLATVGN